MSGYVESAKAHMVAHGLRVTRVRTLVLEALARADQPLSAYEIQAVVKAAGERLDVVGVYRTLDLLREHGLVHRGVTSGKYARCVLPEAGCERKQHDHCHHHLVCRGCGRVEEVHCPGVGLVEQALAAQSDFRIDGHVLEFTGVCRPCQEAAWKR